MKSHSPEKVKIIGHRGCASVFPENTLEAILHGIQSGAEMIEIDLRLSKDQEVVLSHNENLSEVFGINQNVSEKTWQRLSELTIKKEGKTFHLLRLRDLFQFMPQDVHFYLELKATKSPNPSEWNKKLVDKVISILKKEKIKRRCLLMSFDQDLIKYLKKKHPSYSAGLVVKSKAILKAILKNKEIQYDCLALNQKLFKNSNLKMALNSGIPLIAWTVNDKRLWKRIASYGPLGIVTDYPSKFSDFSKKC